MLYLGRLYGSNGLSFLDICEAHYGYRAAIISRVHRRRSMARVAYPSLEPSGHASNLHSEHLVSTDSALFFPYT